MQLIELKDRWRFILSEPVDQKPNSNSFVLTILRSLRHCLLLFFYERGKLKNDFDDLLIFAALENMYFISEDEFSKRTALLDYAEIIEEANLWKVDGN